RHLDRVAEVGASGGARAAERVAVGTLLAAALLSGAFLSLHRLHHLLHHVLRAAAKRFERLPLLADRALALTFAQRPLRAAHRLAGIAEAFAGLQPHALQSTR